MSLCFVLVCSYTEEEVGEGWRGAEGEEEAGLQEQTTQKYPRSGL
jgi:hypothetical protein